MIHRTSASGVVDDVGHSAADRLKSRFLRGAAAGAATSIYFGILEAIRLPYSTRNEWSGIFEGATLFLGVVAIAAGAGIVIGLLIGAASLLSGGIGERWSRGRSESRRLSRIAQVDGAFVALLFHAAAQVAYHIAFDKFHRAVGFLERRLGISDHYEIWAVRSSPIVVFLWLLPPTVAIYVFVTRRAAAKPSGDRRVAFLAALALAAAIDTANAVVFVNIYRQVHIAVYLAAFAAVYFAIGRLLFASLDRVAVVLRRRRIAAFALAVGVLTGSHLFLDARRSIESLIFMRSHSARENVRFLRALTDFDRDGASAFFGGGDAAEFDDSVAAWTIVAECGRPTSRPVSARAGDRPTPLARRCLWITIDALRADAVGSVAGRNGDTPAIDAFAARSTVFTSAYAQAPFTSLAFGAMLLSRFPSDGFDHFSQDSLPRFLERQKMKVRSIVPKTFGRLGIGDYGFSNFDASIDDAAGKRTCEATTDAALAALAKDDAVDLLWVHYFDPHSPYVGDEGHADAPPKERYRDEVKAVDRAVSRLLAHVFNAEKRDTAVILCADHGDEFGGHGGDNHGFSLYEPAIHIPLIVHIPGLGQRRIDPSVRQIDIAPTIADILGLRPPATWRGRSLVDFAMTGSDPSFGGTVLSENEEGLIAYRPPKSRWKLLWHRRDAFIELYDVVDDPLEHVNRADDRPTELKNMLEELKTWSSAAGVPIERPYPPRGPLDAR